MLSSPVEFRVCGMNWESLTAAEPPSFLHPNLPVKHLCAEVACLWHSWLCGAQLSVLAVLGLSRLSAQGSFLTVLRGCPGSMVGVHFSVFMSHS